MAQTCTWQGDSGVNTNWSNDNNWHGSVEDHKKPVAGDAVIFSNAVNCTIDATSACASIDCTGYTGTLTQSANITTTGNITLVSGMTFTYTSGTWTHAGTAIIASGGKTFGTFTFNATQTITLADDMDVNGVLTIATGTATINGNHIKAGGGFTGNSTLTGTVHLILDGGGTVSWGYQGTPAEITFDAGAGTITFSGDFNVGPTTSITYTSGTISQGTNALKLNGSQTLDLSGNNWANVTMAAGTRTLASNLSIDGTFLISGASVINLTAAETVTCSGSVTVNAALSGTATLVMDGTGTWSGSSTSGLANNLTITGTVTMSGNCYYKTGTLTTTGGTINAGASTLYPVGACSLDTNGTNFNNFTTGTSVGTASGITLLSDLSIDGTLSNATNVRITGNTLTLSGSLTLANAYILGTTNIVMDGTGTWSAAGSNGVVNNNLTFAAGTNTITIGTGIYPNVYYATGTFTYTNGTIDATTNSSTLNLVNTATLTSSGMSWYNVTLVTAGNTTLGNALDVNGVLTINAGRTLNCAGKQVSIAGNFTNSGTYTHGNNLTVFDGTTTVAGATNFYSMTITAGSSVTLTSGQVFTTANGGVFTALGADGNRITFKSSVATQKADFDVNAGGTYSVDYVNATDIDSAGGQAIAEPTGGVLLRTVNWTSPESVGGGSLMFGFEF